jgi:hypothetical protein
MTPPREVRIGDAEREAAVAALGEHYAAGRLTREEYDERAEQAWTARTASALAPLFADLPAPHGDRPQPSPVASRQAPPAARSRWSGFRPPLLPMLAIFVGVALLTGHFWVFWLLLGLYWWSGRAFRRARREEWRARCADVPGWVQDWQRQSRYRRGW